MSRNVVVSRGWDQWCKRLMELARTGRELKFVIGDHLNRGEELYHDKIWQVLNDTGWSRAYIANVQYVARRIEPDERKEKIGWTIYQSMAPLEKAERAKVITRALSNEGISRDEVRGIVAMTHVNGNGKPPERLPTAKEAAEQEFGQAMAVCATLMRHHDDFNLIEALDDLVAKATVLRAMLESMPS